MKLGYLHSVVLINVSIQRKEFVMSLCSCYIWLVKNNRAVVHVLNLCAAKNEG